MKNILMNVEMIKAILDGRKSRFREAIKSEILDTDYLELKEKDGKLLLKVTYSNGVFKEVKPQYQIGEIVRFIEEVKLPVSDVNGSCLFVDAKITDVRVERLQDISDDDIQAEGSPSITIVGNNTDTIEFKKSKRKNWWIKLWNKTAPKGYKWEDNPYVFVYELERVDNGK